MRALDLTGAIILDHDGRALARAGRPSADDFVRFGDVLETLTQQGWRITADTPDEAQGWMTDLAWHVQRPAAIGAVLMTACGCQKALVVPYPPQPTVRVPLASRVAAGFPGDLQGMLSLEPAQYSVRDFHFVGIERDPQRRVSRAVYREHT